MNINTILFPTDFSHTGDSALELAASLARDSGARLLIVHVQEPPVAYGGGDMYYGVTEPDVATMQAMLGKVLPADAAVRYEHRLVSGVPADALVRLAKEEGVDLIVMGTHGRTGLGRMLMGSVAEAVVRQAPCPVLTHKSVLHEHAPAGLKTSPATTG